MNRYIDSDILVIGSGIAGLSCSLYLNEKYRVTIITKGEIRESNTFYAQGGIAAVSSKQDSFNFHIKDTIRAGDGLCDKKVVEDVVNKGPSLIDDLIKWNVKFTRQNENSAYYDLTKEGGHSRRRVYHKDDITGEEIQNKLIKKVRKRKNIVIHENHIAINLITRKQNNRKICCGAYVLDKKSSSVLTFRSQVIVLATGGAGKVYKYTSNPDIATGDGIAMAYRIGAKVSNMEFMQFHPTCLFHPQAKSFLISEAVRGEGGLLRLENGDEFMKKYHPSGSLAPRDIVARAIDFEMKKKGTQCVYLDITHKNKKFIKKRFPNIYERCLTLGIDITKQYIPVVPAAHYICGGIKTDINGKTSIKNLFAIGENACTGLHGANRLASNSLLEGLFSAKNLARFIENSFIKTKFFKVKTWNIGKAVSSDEQIMILHNWYEIRRLMWNYVGIVRSDLRLARAKRRINILIKEIQEYYWDFIVTAPLIELRNLATVADLIIRSAQKRKESRGLHYNLNYSSKNIAFKKETLIQK